jgi:hypothetical protein
MSASMFRSRISLGSQLRETLTEMRSKEQLNGWTVAVVDDRLGYTIEDAYGRTEFLTPGETMAWVNCYGYDVRIGKA